MPPHESKSYGYLLRCMLCRAEWVSSIIEDCHRCGAEQVSYTPLVPKGAK